MTEATKRPPSVPPRLIVRAAWKAHRAMYSVLGRKALRPATPTKWGMFRITTVGRKSGAERKAILGYLDDGPNLVTMAMNGWASPEPKWWLNLQANPDATLEMADGTRREVTAHAATGEERERLWAMWNTLDEDYEGYTKMRAGETAIVVLEPRGGAGARAGAGAGGADIAPGPSRGCFQRSGTIARTSAPAIVPFEWNYLSPCLKQDTIPRRSGRGSDRARNPRPGGQPISDPVHDVFGVSANAVDQHRRERVLEQDAHEVQAGHG